MNFITLNIQKDTSRHYTTSFALNLQNSKEIWLFNCYQGCQHVIKKQQIKTNYISKIIISNLNTENISGLLGLLSTLSLINRKKNLYIYSPQGLQPYLKSNQRHSQTIFKYKIYFHTIQTGLIINHDLCQVYAFSNNIELSFLILSNEKLGKFRLSKAQDFHLKEGPLYGKLKQGSDLLLPDGLILNSIKFKRHNKKGIQNSFITNKYHKRNFIEVTIKNYILKHIINI